MTAMAAQHHKAEAFRRLHERRRCFLTPNPWDAGSARLLAGMGFAALATTGAGIAFSRGVPDNRVGFDAMMADLREITQATELPVTADLEDGFGRSPEAVQRTILAAAEAGAVGGSIEDARGDGDAPLYAIDEAAERVRAAVEAARSLPFPFLLTARAENFVCGLPDLGDTIRRLQRYQDAGADVLFAPGVWRADDIAAIVASVDRPVNVMMGLPHSTLDMRQLSDLGVTRVSVGGSLARAALGAFLRAATELREHGTFAYADAAISGKQLNELLHQSRSSS